MFQYSQKLSKGEKIVVLKHIYFKLPKNKIVEDFLSKSNFYEIDPLKPRSFGKYMELENNINASLTIKFLPILHQNSCESYSQKYPKGHYNEVAKSFNYTTYHTLNTNIFFTNTKEFKVNTRSAHKIIFGENSIAHITHKDLSYFRNDSNSNQLIMSKEKLIKYHNYCTLRSRCLWDYFKSINHIDYEEEVDPNALFKRIIYFIWFSITSILIISICLILFSDSPDDKILLLLVGATAFSYYFYYEFGNKFTVKK